MALFGVPHLGRAYRKTRPAGSPGGPNQKERQFVTIANPSGTNTTRFTRRKALKLGVAATALPLVHIRTGHAAGKLSVGFWDHWVPAGNDIMKQQVAAFAPKPRPRPATTSRPFPPGKSTTTPICSSRSTT